MNRPSLLMITPSESNRAGPQPRARVVT